MADGHGLLPAADAAARHVTGAGQILQLAEVVCTERVEGAGDEAKTVRDCFIPEGKLGDIRGRTRQHLKKAIRGAYTELPISTDAFFKKVSRTFLTEGNIKSVFERTGDITEEEHNSERLDFRGSKTTQGTIAKKGLIGRRIVTDTVCEPNYDWANSPHYWDVDRCEQVDEELKDGIPTAMYSAPIRADKAMQTILDYAGYVTPYTDGTPEPCHSEHVSAGEKAARFAIRILGIVDLDFIMKIYDHDGISYWNMLRSCASDSGEEIVWKDMLYDFGFRVYVPVTVQIDDRLEEHTLIVASIAAAGNMAIGISSESAYRRYLSGEFAKKILLTAMGNGWKIED